MFSILDKNDRKMKRETFHIRPETPADFPEIYSLIQTAFETAKVKDGDEQDFTDRLRASEGYIPELGLVAEQDGKLIGQILFTRTFVERPDGSRFETLLLAPLSVLLEYREQGVGSALMREGFRLALEQGYTSAFLCGDPGYYERFGFRSSAGFGIHSKSGIPPQFTLAVQLEPDALKGVAGMIDAY